MKRIVALSLGLAVGLGLSIGSVGTRNAAAFGPEELGVEARPGECVDMSFILSAADHPGALTPLGAVQEFHPAAPSGLLERIIDADMVALEKMENGLKVRAYRALNFGTLAQPRWVVTETQRSADCHDLHDEAGFNVPYNEDAPQFDENGFSL